VISIYDVGTLPTQYDLVVENEVFEHLSHPERAIEEVKKMTRKYILISVPHEPYFRMANIMRLKYLNDAGNIPGHINHRSTKQLAQFLVSHGLKIKSIQCSTLLTFAYVKLVRLLALFKLHSSIKRTIGYYYLFLSRAPCCRTPSAGV
jgi:2-polyprenyl-3-methyl-5-hydroxy-6-metoxy-1,4-benzoquinol methylase